MTSRQNLATLPRRQEDWGALIARTAQRDEAALAALYDGTSALVHGLALRILRDPGAAEEITADVYLQVWRQALRYDEGRGGALAWLLTVTRSRAIDRLRAGSTQRAVTAPLHAARRVASPAPNPEESSVAGEHRRIVQRALGLLPAQQRRPIELAYFEGLSHSQIAATLGEPLGTVKTRVRLGMARLREALAHVQDIP